VPSRFILIQLGGAMYNIMSMALSVVCLKMLNVPGDVMHNAFSIGVKCGVLVKIFLEFPLKARCRECVNCTCVGHRT
jgi:hypothetical protein